MASVRRSSPGDNVTDDNRYGEIDRRYGAVLMAVISALIASWVIAHRLTTTGLRDDEGFSISTSWRSWGSLARLTFDKETNGFLYAVLLKVWMLGGTSTNWLRMLSALAFVVAAGLVTWTAARIVGRTGAACTAALFLLSGTAVEFGQYIRFYALVMAIAAASMAAFLAEVGRPRRVTLLAWGLCLAALVSTHLVAACLVVAQLLSLFLLESGQRQLKRRIAAVIPSLAIATVSAVLVMSHDEGQDINQQLGSAAVADVLYSLSGSGGARGLLGYVVLASLSIAGLASVLRSGGLLWPRTASRVVADQGVRAYRLMLLAPWVNVIVGVTMMTVGSLVTNVMVGRYTAFMIPSVAVGLGTGVAYFVRPLFLKPDHPSRSVAGVALPPASSPPWSGSRTARAALAAVMLSVGGVSALSGWTQWRDEARIDWQPVIALVASQSTNADGVLFANDSMRLYFEVEHRRHPDRLAARPLFPTGDWGTFGTGDQTYEPFTVTDVEAALLEHERLWLVVEAGLLSDPRVAAVVAAFRPTLVGAFDETATVFLLVRSA